MDDNTLRQTLTDTLTDHAHDAIPDDYDRWSHIQDALLSQEEDPMKLQHLRVAPRNPRRTRRLIFILAAALLLTTTAVYAVVQVFPPPINDPGVEGIQREGYTTELNLVQRVHNIEVQLNWGYIDSSRVVLDYQIFAINSDGTRTTDHRYSIYKALLKNKDAVLEERTPSMDTGSGTQRVEEGILTYNYPGKFDPTTMPDVMNFQLEILIVEAKIRPLSLVQEVLRSFIRIPGTLRSPTTDHLYEKPDPLFRPESTAEPNVDASGPMLFDFALPVQRAVIIEPQQSIEANGTTATLTMISAAPSRIEMGLCFTVPPIKSAWEPQMTVSLDGKAVRWSGGMSRPPDENGLACSEWNFDIFTTPGMTIDIKIDSISRGLDLGRDPELDQQSISDIQQAFMKRGIPLELTFDAQGKVMGYSHNMPAGAELEYRAALLELGYLIEGPWEFSVEIPAQ